MTAAVFHVGGPVDAPILLRRQGVSAGHWRMEVPGRTLMARPSTCFGMVGANFKEL